MMTIEDAVTLAERINKTSQRLNELSEKLDDIMSLLFKLLDEKDKELYYKETYDFDTYVTAIDDDLPF